MEAEPLLLFSDEKGKCQKLGCWREEVNLSFGAHVQPGGDDF